MKPQEQMMSDEVSNLAADDCDRSVTVLKNCRHGKMLYLRRDQYIGRSLNLYGEFSELEGVLFSQIVRQNEIVVEVGANIGAHTVHLAKLVGPSGSVLAFEPQRIIFQLLCANVALNELFNVRTYHSAAGRDAGTLKVPNVDYAAENNFGGLSLANVTTGEDVPVIMLDSLSLPSLKLLKIDVEGMEIDVLSGGRRLIAQHRPILYVENDRRQNSEQLIRLIEELGYAMWWHAPKLFNPDNYAKNSKNVFGNIVSANLLCAPNDMPIQIEGARMVSGPTDWWQ
jgi:FkbM family methyltransferase